jgi:hypothetical protein
MEPRPINARAMTVQVKKISSAEMRSIYERPCKEVEDFKRDMRSPEKAVQMNL